MVEAQSPSESAPDPTRGGDMPDPVAEPGNREQEFCVSTAARVTRYTFLALLTLVGVGLLFLLAPMLLGAGDSLLLILLGLWLLALVRYWVYLLGMPHRVRLLPEGQIEFVSVFRSRRLELREIASLKVSAVYPSYLKVGTTRRRPKSLTLINHVDGLHRLVGAIERANPGLVTRGC